MHTPMPETLTVGDELTFEVRRSTRRSTLGITVDRDGSLVLALPEECSLEEGRAFAEDKQFWIYTKLARRKLLRRPVRAKRYVEGEGHYYLGRSYRLRLIDDADPDVSPLRLYQGRWRLHADKCDQAAELFRAWYVSHGQRYMKKRVEGLAHRLEVIPAGVTVRPLGYRWGSCSPDGTLNFHWRTVLLPVRLVDYVVVHEMAHLHEPNHGDAFWKRVERAMPDYEQRKRELDEEGGGYF